VDLRQPSAGMALSLCIQLALFFHLSVTALSLEDNALLVGAVTSFLAVAAVMYFTRDIDWYSSIPSEDSRPSEAAAKDAV
jgi:inner membrane protein involved in colicin E2 resistance